MRVLLGDLRGRVRAELTSGSVSRIETRLNRIDNLTVTVKKDTPASTADLLKPGSRIYIEFENGLPPWGGILDLPHGLIEGGDTFRAYSMDYMLQFSTTARTRAFYDVTVGQMFYSLISEAERRYNYNIKPGRVWSGGGVHSIKYHSRDLYWIINNSIRDLETCDYNIRAYLKDNVISFYIDLEETLGNDRRSKVALIQGANIGGNIQVNSQGSIINRVAVVGSGSTWAEKDIRYGVEVNSQNLYGLRELTYSPNVSYTSTLVQYADRKIRQMAYPHTRATFDVLDVLPSGYSEYKLGDIVTVSLPSYGRAGYEAPMRIIARGYDPPTKRCNVVCEEEFTYYPAISDGDEFLIGET